MNDDAPIRGDDQMVRDEEFDDYGAQNASEEEPSEADDLMENMDNDYEAKPELDRYEEIGLDDEGDYDALGYEERMEVDRKLGQQDFLRRMQDEGRRIPGALIGEYDAEDDHEEQMAQFRQERFRMMREEAKADDDQDLNDMGDDAAIDFDVVQGPLQSWLKKPEVIRFVIRQF